MRCVRVRGFRRDGWGGGLGRGEGMWFVFPEVGVLGDRFLAVHPSVEMILAHKVEAPVSSFPHAPATENPDRSGSGAPNLLGVAYDSSGDEEDAEVQDGEVEVSQAVATTAIPSARVGVGGGAAGVKPAAGSMPSQSGGLGSKMTGRKKVSEPDEAKRVVVEKMVAFVSRNGQAFEDRVREREKSNPAFEFLSPTSKHHAYYKQCLAKAKGEMPLHATPASSRTSGTVPEDDSNAAKTGGPMAPARTSGARGNVDVVDRGSLASENAGLVSPRNGDTLDGVGRRLVPGVVAAAVTRSADHAHAVNVSSSARENKSQDQDKVELPGLVRKGDGSSKYQKIEGLAAGDAPAAIVRSDQPAEGEAEAVSGDGTSESGDVGWDRETLLKGVDSSEAGTGLCGAGEDDFAVSASADGDDNPETRRANRLKRARLMKGHYKLAVLHHSSGGEMDMLDGRHEQKQGSPVKNASSGTRVVPEEGREDDDHLSANGISDLDDDDDGSDDDDDDDGSNSSDGEKTNKSSPLKGPATESADGVRKKAGAGGAKKNGDGATTRFGAHNEEDEAGLSRRERRGVARSPEKRDMRNDTRNEGSSSRRGDKGRRRSRSRSRSRGLAVMGNRAEIGMRGDRSSPRRHAKEEKSSKIGRRSREGRVREGKQIEGSRRQLSPSRRSSPDKRRKGGDENRGKSKGKGKGMDRDGERADKGWIESERKKRRASRSPGRDRAGSSRKRVDVVEERSKGRISRRGESRERTRERRDDREDRDTGSRRDAYRDKREDRDRESKERRRNRRRSSSRERERSRERGTGSSRRLGSRR